MVQDTSDRDFEDFTNKVLIAYYLDEQRNRSPRVMPHYKLIDEFFGKHIAGAYKDDAVAVLLDKKLLMTYGDKREVRLSGKGRIYVERFLKAMKPRERAGFK